MSPAAAIPEGSVIITPVEMYHQQQEMNKTLLNVSTKLDAVVTKLDHNQEDQERRMSAIDGPDGEIKALKVRVSSLERWRYISTGVVAALSSGATAAVFQAVAKH